MKLRWGGDLLDARKRHSKKKESSNQNHEKSSSEKTSNLNTNENEHHDQPGDVFENDILIEEPNEIQTSLPSPSSSRSLPESPSYSPHKLRSLNQKNDENTNTDDFFDNSVKPQVQSDITRSTFKKTPISEDSKSEGNSNGFP